MNKYTYKISRVPAEPRSKRQTDTGREGASSADGSVFVSGRGDSAPQYWERVIATADGAELPEEQYYLTPQGASNVSVPGDVTAYSDNPGKEPARLPVSTDYETTGLFRAKRGGGLIYDVSTGSWMVDSQMMGGLDEGQLKIYLDQNKYITDTTLNAKGFLSLSSTLTGYKKLTYQPLSTNDNVLTALGKLEGNFSNYVDLTTNQSVGGVKTFGSTIYTMQDVVGYSSGSQAGETLPVSTDYETTGLFRAKRNGGLIYDVSTGSWMVDPSFQGGGGLEEVPVYQEGTGNGVTAVFWDSSIKKLHVSKDDFATYNHEHSQYATTSWVSSSFATANHTHSQYATKTYVDDTFSVIGHTHSQYVTLDTAQTINGKKTFKPGLITGDVTNVYIEFSGGNSLSGKDKNASIRNLYFNYNSASKNTKIDKDNNFMTAGDVAAYGTGGTMANFVPVADAYTYGLVKIDNNTIKKDENGRLYCTVQGGGGTTAGYWRPSVNASGVLSWSLDSSTSAPSSVNIKGPKGNKGDPGADGAKGQGVTYQWSGTSLRLGTIDSEGYTSWGSYVNLKGEKGDPGSGGSGGSVNQLPATVFINQGAVFRNSSNNIGIKMSGGNGLSGWAGSTSGNIGNLYLNSGAPSSAKVYITNYSAVSSSDIRLKNRMDNVGGVLNALCDIDVFYYTMKDDEAQEVQIGVSAQEVMKHFPSVVHEIVPEMAEPYFSVDYQTLTTIFSIQGLKELHVRHKALERRVTELEDTIKEMKQIIEQLKGGEA